MPEEPKGERKNPYILKDDKVYQTLYKIVHGMAEDAKITKTFSDQNVTIYEISKADPGIIIGKHGHTLDAIQLLVNMVANKGHDKEIKKYYVIDIDGYRKRKECSLKKYAIEKAGIVKREKIDIPLYFMNSFERRIVHLALKDDLQIETYSKGKEPLRRIIITPVSSDNRYHNI